MPDIFAAAAKTVYETLQQVGDTEICDAVFYPVVGDSIPCTVWKYLDEKLQPGAFDGQVTEEILIIEYQLLEIDRDVVDGEYFIIDGDTYTADGITGRDSVTVKVAVV